MKLIKLSLFICFVMTIVIITSTLFSQSTPNWDDPNLDRIPYNLLLESRNQPLRSPSSINSSVITNDDGYDNFYLGVDFAEPHMSGNPMNPLQYFNAFNTNATHYTNNGYDWFINNPNYGFPMAGDPVTAYDSLGRLYYDNMYENGSGSILGTKIAYSDNNGTSWTITNGNTGNDKNWIAADQSAGPYSNYVYGTMTNGLSCNVIRSTNRGASFNLVQSLAPHNLPGAMPCVGPNVIGGDIPGGVVYVVTNSGGSFNAVYNFFKSTNGGASFTLVSSQSFANYVGTNVGGRNSVQNMRTRPYPFIAADNSYGPFRGRLYLVYASNNPIGDGNKPDIFCRYSTDQGLNWSLPVTINDDPGSTANHQWHPSIWCDKQTGRLYVKWFDTRNVPTSDSAEVYASYSSNGGVSFAQNQKISTAKFRINCTTCGGGGTPAYYGDYDAITSYGKTSHAVWSDFRNGAFGSYTAYYPDYAMKIRLLNNYIKNNDSAFIRVSIPSVRGYTDGIKISAEVDTLPVSGSIQLSFVNGRDSLTSYPDSVTVRVKTTGSVTPGIYGIITTAKGPNGIPVHKRIADVYINVAPLSVGTNREGTAQFQINGIQYTTRQTIPVVIGTSVNIKAISPVTVTNNRYVFQSWSNSGDTTQNIVINEPTTLTAFYKIQYRLLITSSQGNTFGGGLFYDSATAFQFGVNSRIVVNSGTTYYFRGWNGAGNGAYTSPDSTGLDSIVTLAISNPIIETARWTTTIGIQNISENIPKEFKMYQNYPNPFNPVTNILFDIAKAGFVELKVYDILGKEVNVIVNENLKPGSYRVSFEGHNLASGIYFYKITAPGFNDIKRMLLIK